VRQALYAAAPSRLIDGAVAYINTHCVDSENAGQWRRTKFRHKPEKRPQHNLAKLIMPKKTCRQHI